jgi:hypothetical protein
MALVIDASDLVTRRRLAVDSGGVHFHETTIGGRARRFTFESIECLLLSPSGVLSFQVGNEVFQIQTKQGNAKHQEVMDTLVRALRGSVPPV